VGDRHRRRRGHARRAADGPAPEQAEADRHPDLDGDLVYAAVDDGGEQQSSVVVSLPGGRVLSSSEEPPPFLLPADRGPSC
jgi:hypothetical protein